MNDMRYKNVVWDWNGTLLDDVKISVDTINVMLERKHLGKLTVEEYRSIFGFPVKPYYESIGFDFSQDDWEEVSRDFVNIYNDLAEKVELTPGIIPVLEGIKRKGIRQYVLSALKEDLLIGMLERFGIREYFEGVCGSNNIYADGKVARGMEMLQISARDTFYELARENVAMKRKQFAMGFRIEHKREFIDEAQYGKKFADILPAADYRLSMGWQLLSFVWAVIFLF